MRAGNGWRARKSYLAGIGTVLLATLACGSFSGVFTRLLTTDIWTAIAWRSFFGGLFLLFPYLIMNGRQSLQVLTTIGRPGILFILCQVICQACTVGGLYFTSVANVTVIYHDLAVPGGGSRLVAAAGEDASPHRHGRPGFDGRHSHHRRRLGRRRPSAGRPAGDRHDLSFAFIIVIPRARRDLPLLPTTILSAFTTALIFAPFSAPATLDLQLVGAGGIRPYEFLGGAVSLRVRRAAGECGGAALIGTLEIVFAPLWVWMMFTEQPAAATLIGGALVLAVIVRHLSRLARSARRLSARSSPRRRARRCSRPCRSSDPG